MTNTKTYSVAWTVVTTASATMNVEAPEGLTNEELVTFIRENCHADFDIELDEYDAGFAELETNFCVD